MSAPKLSHVAADGSLTMVDVGNKAASARSARAQALVRLSAAAADALRAATLPKGDAFVAAQLAGIMAAKTIYDMCKAVDKGISIADLRLLEKSGGKSGAWRAP